MKQFAIIGDIHGRSLWKQVESVIDKVEKVIFLGDYMDSFHIDSSDILQNLKDIIEFKKKYSDKTVLLLGNHDLPYINIGTCQGFNKDAYFVANEIFTKNLKLFKLAHYENIEFKRCLFTHAGLTFKFEKILEDTKIYSLTGSIVETLNHLLRFNSNLLEYKTPRRGGVDKTGSIVWADLKDLFNDASKTFEYQIVGHTFVDSAFFTACHTKDVTLGFFDDQPASQKGYHLLQVDGFEISFLDDLDTIKKS